MGKLKNLTILAEYWIKKVDPTVQDIKSYSELLAEASMEYADCYDICFENLWVNGCYFRGRLEDLQETIEDNPCIEEYEYTIYKNDYNFIIMR